MSINMTKGQAISLQKNDGGSLTAVRMGLGWQAAPRRGLFGSRTREIDLDASAVLFADKQPVDVVFFRHLVSDDGSVRHTGDNLVGGVGQGGDDEAHPRRPLPRPGPHRPDRLHRELLHGPDVPGGAERVLPPGRRDQRPGARPLHAGRRRPVHGPDHGEGAPSGPGLVDDGPGNPANGRTFQDLMPTILPAL
ncbi:hypothetical protein GCM10011428_08470 [Streptomyces violaceus]